MLSRRAVARGGDPALVRMGRVEDVDGEILIWLRRALGIVGGAARSTTSARAVTKGAFAAGAFWTSMARKSSSSPGSHGSASLSRALW